MSKEREDVSAYLPEDEWPEEPLYKRVREGEITRERANNHELMPFSTTGESPLPDIYVGLQKPDSPLEKAQTEEKGIKGR